MGSFHDPNNSSLYITLYILLACIPAVRAVCYDPNGDTKSDPIFQPCGNSRTTSMCCASNRSNSSGGNYANGLTADLCLENGLCENKIFVTYDQGETTLVTLYYRDYCTSSNWKTGGGCLDVCTEQTNPRVGLSNSTVAMTPCDGTANSSTWCCGDSSSCCGTDSAISIAQTVSSGLPTTTTTTSSISTTIPTTTAAAAAPPSTTSSTSASPASTSSSSSSPSSALSGGAKVGIGVGGSLGSIGVITTALGGFLLLKRRPKRGNDERTPQPVNTAAVPNNHPFIVPQEKPHDPVNYVIPRYELPGEHR